MTDFIGIVTVLFNSDDVLPGFFESLSKQQDVRYRLYVIDNSKSDSGSRLSHELADKYYIDAKIIFNDANVGVAKGNNQGVDLASKDGCNYILLSNNDIEFYDEKLFSKLIQNISNSSALAVATKINYFEEKNKIWFGGGMISMLKSKSPHLRLDEVDDDVNEVSRYIDYAPTCFMLLKHEVFQRVGNFDEKYFVYYDDTDFLLRMHRAEIKLLYVPNLIIYHKVSSSTGGGESDFSRYYLTRNRIYFIRKNYVGLSRYFALAYFWVRIILSLMKSPLKKKHIYLKALRDGCTLNV
jgi:GT2 family glycosyltransferase